MDKISQLSDDLLIKILSLVPTKDAVAMSTLCKRWMSLWTLVPRLIFDDYSEEDEETNENHGRSLSQIVSDTLLLHKAPVLETFHLNIASKCSSWEIGRWVRFAIDRFVRDLKICFYYDHGFVSFPSRFFRCETLETLELDRVVVTEVPSRFSFRSLKTLQLLSVKYSDKEAFYRFISNCPVLEDLVVETCNKDNVGTFTVDMPSLESLSVRTSERESKSADHLLVIHSHSLKNLKIVDYVGKVNVIGDFRKLVEANFQSVRRHYKARYPSGTVLFQLVRLEICSCEDNWTNMLVSVLQHSPKLQVLKIVMNHWHHLDRKVFWIQPSCVPECFLHHLKTFEWRDYEGTQVEKEVAIYIIKNARRLVSATIYPYSIKSVGKHQMFEELEIASRGSRACEFRVC